MEKTFEPHAIEARWTQYWEDNGCFTPSNCGDPYCIMIPPPNVTGTLHMGHAFQDTIMDALTRYHRMRGRNTLWQPGTDHAGIATQMVVERQLNAEGKTREDIGRDAFVERVWQWKEVSGGTITRQLRRMGASLDWEHERFTMDEGLSAAVRETFVRLYDEGLIYRGKRLVNWDPVLRTAVSDLEVVSEEEDGQIWHLRYPFIDGSGYVVVATTRPETMLGDSAVAVHPHDERYRALIGKELELPLTGRRIRVIADDYVDPEFGSGCVKITPAHDFNDYDVGKRHDLAQINIFTEDARINDNAPRKYQGMDRFEARKTIIADLTTLGLLDKVEAHRLKVPRGDRSQSVIEPLLTDQWFVKAQPLAAPAIKAVEDGRIRFVPENWSKTYFEWMRNIDDWCISRQIWWGHRIPAWYDSDGNYYVGHDEAQARTRNGLAADLTLQQDPDVLDTWFSSALWPFSTLGWPQDSERLKTFYPTSVLVTGFDIIFFWVARMIMMGLKFMDQVPFHEIYIHGLVRDADGNKMSKSKGNILDPIDLIDGIELEPLVAKRTSGLMQPELAPAIEAATRRQFADGIPSFGTDALRFTFCSLATQGRDIRFDLGRIEGYRNFCNKLWNAARFVIHHTEGKDCAVDDSASVELGLAERWIVSRLQQTELAVGEAIESYRLDLASQAIYEFIWNEYCDWYLEFTKPVLFDENSSIELQRGTRRTLLRVLETMLRLAHPLMPFITEDIWQQVRDRVGKQGPSIMAQPYPVAQPEKIDSDSLSEMQWVQDVVLGVRRIRGEMDIKPSVRLDVLLNAGDARDDERAAAHAGYLSSLGGLNSISRQADDQPQPKSAKVLLAGLEILIPLEGLIDKDAELARIDRELARKEKDLANSQAKLTNKKFIARAPAPVVEQERERVAQFNEAIDKLHAQRKLIGQ